MLQPNSCFVTTNCFDYTKSYGVLGRKEIYGLLPHGHNACQRILIKISQISKPIRLVTYVNKKEVRKERKKKVKNTRKKISIFDNFLIRQKM